MTIIDWERIRAEYVAGQVSYRALAKKHGIEGTHLRKRASAEGWVAQRQEFRKRRAAKALQKAEEDVADSMALIYKVGRIILERFLAAVQEGGLILSPRDAERWARILIDLKEAGEGRVTVIERVDLSQLSDEDLDAIVAGTVGPLQVGSNEGAGQEGDGPTPPP